MISIFSIFRFLNAFFQILYFLGPNWIDWAWYGIFLIRQMPTLHAGLDKIINIYVPTHMSESNTCSSFLVSSWKKDDNKTVDSLVLIRVFQWELYCIYIMTRGGMYSEIKLEPKANYEDTVRGIFQRLRLCFTVYRDSSLITDIINF